MLKLLDSLLDLFFPRKCIVCHALSILPVCIHCQPKAVKPTEFAKGLYYLYKYEGAIKTMLHLYKLRGHKHIFDPYKALFLKYDIFDNYDIIIPVPCHRIRLLQRKFNHLNYLFKGLPKFRKDIVIRKKYTGYLHKLKRTERLAIIKGAFMMINPEKVKDMNILIIDDIFTTGCTFKELSLELEKYNPKSVDGFFICRA